MILQIIYYHNANIVSQFFYECKMSIFIEYEADGRGMHPQNIQHILLMALFTCFLVTAMVKNSS